CEAESATYLSEACRVRALHAGMVEKLTESVVPAFLGRNISNVTTFMFNYSAFSTSHQVLDRLCHLFLGGDLAGPRAGFLGAPALSLLQDEAGLSACHLAWRGPEGPCLPSPGLRTNRGHEHLVPTVRATVTQLHNVAHSVVTACLKDLSTTAQDRARGWSSGSRWP
ncbi:hypothetical protein HPG69_011388, partial [Diceros bicornis minor]